MKRIETQNRSREELEAMVGELKSKLTGFHFDLAEKKLKDTNSLAKTKKDLARVLTALNNLKP